MPPSASARRIDVQQMANVAGAFRAIEGAVSPAPVRLNPLPSTLGSVQKAGPLSAAPCVAQRELVIAGRRHGIIAPSRRSLDPEA
jgi:hypothetical protein